jgi:hypothetical protein
MTAMTQQPVRTAPDVPETIPAVLLRGSDADKLKTLDAAMARLQELRGRLVGEPAAPEAPEIRGRYLHAPVWPWFAAGWILGALFMLMFVLARALA